DPERVHFGARSLRTQPDLGPKDGRRDRDRRDSGGQSRAANAAGGELHGREREQEGRVGLVADVPPRFEVELVSLLCVERGRGVTQQSIELLVLDAGEWAIGA